MKSFCLAGLAFLMSQAASAQVIINEFSAANYSEWAQSGGWSSIYEDWVELYNPTGSAVDISGYYMSDDIADPTKWEVPAGTTVPANGFKSILLSGTGDYDPGYLGYTNTNFKVTQTGGEDIVFADSNGNILESYDFAVIGPNQANHSWGRATNGANEWVIFTDPTPEANNGGPSGKSYADKPELSVEAGYYGSSINVTITTTEPNSTIYYALGGGVPTDASTTYSAAVNVSTSQPLRAIVYSADPEVLPSFIETNSYFFGDDQHTIPFCTITGLSLNDGSWNGNEETCIEFFTADGTFVAESHGDSNEHGNDSNAYSQRGFDYITRDARGYDNVVESELFHHTDRAKYERLIFKAAANDNYPFSGDGAHIRDAYCHELSVLGNLHLDERKTESYVLYINCAYWGVYDMREKADDIDFTDYNYDQPEGFVDFIKTWGGTWEEYGSIDDWNSLKDFILTNDMTDQANYDYVLTQYNHMSLIDYFIMNGYVVCTDWLNWNTAWWRGRHPDGEAKKWKYVLWDLDATFGHYINYTGVPDTSPQADPCNPENLGDPGGQGHVPVLNALFDNENFFYDYINRYASLSNTIFSCEQMIGVLDSMIAVIEPEMQEQIDRWGGSYAGWQTNVQELRDFIEERCADEIIGGLEDCYDVTAYTLTVVIEGVGEIQVSSVDLNQDMVPWDGIFFGDIPIDLAVPGGECGTFAGWEIISGTGVLSDPFDPNSTLTIQSDVTLQATFVTATGTVTILTDVQPAGAGIVTLDGANITTYPQEDIFTLGSLHTMSVAENEWYEFDHWESNFTDIGSNDELTNISFTSCTSDTIIAVFNAIPHFTLTMGIEPLGAGTVQKDGVEIPSYPYTEELEGDIDYYFITVPDDEWSIFSHWEINHHVLSPDEFDTNVMLHLTANDTLIAVYNVIEHYTYTVLVDPPFSGTVLFNNNLMTSDELTVEMGVDQNVDFLAVPSPFWNFRNWEAKNHIPFPNDVDKQVYFDFATSDTIIAHFDIEPFVIYVPNSFSPNDDGINDVFKPVGVALDPDDYVFRVFNRWGEKIFETDDPEKGWDGSTREGEYYTADGTYVYFLRAKSVHEAEYKELTGSILVFR